MRGVATMEEAIARGLDLSARTLVVAAGFEDRACAFPLRLIEHSMRPANIIVLDYPDVKMNEPARARLLEKVKELSDKVTMIQSDLWLKNGEECALIADGGAVIDISGMDRILLFRVLDSLDRSNVGYWIAYTEAEQYFPLKNFYDSLFEGRASQDQAFARYLDQEKSEFAYSYDCDLVEQAGFEGNPEPGRPFMLVAFFAFKRSRLQIVLDALEVERKFLVLSKPVRSDLLWRQKCMEIANWDLIRKNRGSIETLSTLDPSGAEDLLKKKIVESKDYTRFNVVIAPLGSKMQTLGCYAFWREHRDVKIVFSKPRTFFPDAFSLGARNTFFIEG